LGSYDLRIGDSNSSQARPNNKALSSSSHITKNKRSLLKSQIGFVKAESAEEGPPLLGTIPRYKTNHP